MTYKHAGCYLACSFKITPFQVSLKYIKSFMLQHNNLITSKKNARNFSLLLSSDQSILPRNGLRTQALRDRQRVVPVEHLRCLKLDFPLSQLQREHSAVLWVFSTVETDQQGDNSPEFPKTIIWGLKLAKESLLRPVQGRKNNFSSFSQVLKHP